MKKINKIILDFFRRRFVFPVTLLLIWLILTLFYIFNYNLSLSVISYSHNKNNFSKFNTNRIYAGDIIKGEFVAKENYLGIVTISFTTFNQVAYADEDTLIFRIKEKNKKDWYYENTYRSGSIFQLPFYPFGFPKISDSRGKTYDFEIQSLSGNQLNAVALNSWEPVLVTRYQAPKQLLLQNKTALYNFFARKIFVAFENQDVLFFSFVYFLPFLFYLTLFATPFKRIFLPIFQRWEDRFVRFAEKTIVLREMLAVFRFVKNVLKKHLDIVLISIILINIFFIPLLNDLALLVVSSLWLYTAELYKRTSRESFTVGILLLIICPFILFFKLENIAEKASVWAYMFFIAGTIQIFEEQN